MTNNTEQHFDALNQQHKIDKEISVIVQKKHFITLKIKYRVFGYATSSYRSEPLYEILKKLDKGKQLESQEVAWLNRENRLKHESKIFITYDFIRLKNKYKATQYQDSSVSSPLYPILKLLDAKKRLSETQINWLESNKLFETLENFQQHESVMKIQFSNLKAKYQATKHSDSSVSSPLYQILLNIDADKPLSQSEFNWLEEYDLTETFALVTEIEEKRHFAKLKKLYKATECQDSSLSCHLYKVLKQIYIWNKLSESDINFLKKRKLTKTLSCAIDRYAASLKAHLESGHPLSKADIDWLKQNGREEIITFTQKKHFETLKSKYEVFWDYSYNKPSSDYNQLYDILSKLDQGKRLEPEEFAWLQIQNLLQRESKIFTTYHKIEAIFYEQEHKRTGNKWNLASASSHWRSAVQAKLALKLTDNLKIDKIQNNKLKSALSTTRGGAFRDMSELDKAEDCALQAIKYFPSSHHPYTLMGALCYERGDYGKGDMWFEKAIKRGALPRDQDAEIKRVIKRANNAERRKIMAYLLEKDSQRYKWVKKYIDALEKKAKHIKSNQLK